MRNSVEGYIQLRITHSESSLLNANNGLIKYSIQNLNQNLTSDKTDKFDISLLRNNFFLDILRLQVS